MLPLPAVTTDALVHADFVDARAAVATRVALTVVNVWRTSDTDSSELFLFCLT